MDKEFYEAIIETQQKTIEKLSETNQSLVKFLVINVNQNKPVEGVTLAEYEANDVVKGTAVVHEHAGCN